MEFRNFTPFPALAFQALDQSGSLNHVVAMRQSLTIRPQGMLLCVDEQEPLVVADEYFGDMNRSSVARESDLAPFKPKCDVIVVASAHSPHGKPCPSFDVSVRIFQSESNSTTRLTGNVLDKTLRVTGPRYWKKHKVLGTWALTPAEPIDVLPLRYEYAYGGELLLNGQESEQRATARGTNPKSVPPLRHTVVETNPVGRGYMENWFLKETALDQFSAPQIEDPLNPVTALGTHYPAQGFGVVTKAWLPRRVLSGTIDDTFGRSNRWLPPDFDFAFWNGAHPDLQITYLNGDEAVELTHMTQAGRLRFELPGYRPYLLVRYSNGRVTPAAMNIDTLWIDVDAGKVAVICRAFLPVAPNVRVLEARLATKAMWNGARQSADGRETPYAKAAQSTSTPQ